MEQFLPTLNVAGVLAFFAPLLTTAISRLTWSGTTKQIVAIVAAVVVALFALLVTDGFKSIPGNENQFIYIGTVILVVIAIAQVAYKLIWVKTGIDAKLAAATATAAEKDAFLTQNTVAGTVDSTESKTAEAVIETDSTPPNPGWSPKH